MKLAVIGYGSIGKRHIENISKIPDVRIIVCTSRKEDKFLQQKKCMVVKTINKCIQQKPDAVIISNVTSKHIDVALQFAQIGCHLFIEKPLSNSFKNVEKLLEISKERKLITLIGCPLRFHPCIIKIKDLLVKEKIGKIISVQSDNGSYLPNWHPGEKYSKSYAARKSLGGGVVLTCIHEIDYLYWFFGNIKNIIAHTGKYSNLNISSEDLAAIILQFKNKVLAEVHLDYFQRPNSRSCKIIGTKGTILWNMDDNIIKKYNISKKKWNYIFKIKNFNLNMIYQDEINHFIDSVKNNKPTINPIEDGAYTLKISLGIKESSRKNKLVSVV